MKNIFRYMTAIRTCSVVLFLATMGVYLQTMAHSIGFIDGGELSTVPIVLGIAHPSGYPLFTLIGRLFSLLPLAAEPAVTMNLFSALCTAAAVIVFFRICIVLLAGTYKRKEHSVAVLTASMAAAGMLAFSQTFWDQSAHTEVYSLHLLLLMLSILTFIRAVDFEMSGDALRERQWLLFAFVLGLCFTNHLTTILLAAGFLYLYFATKKFSKETWLHVLRLAPPFLLGLSVYLYFPIRAAQQPVLNWGNPISPEKIWWHLGAKQYRVWMFSSSEVMTRQFNYFLSQVTVEFYYLPILFALWGAWALLRRDMRRFLFLLLLLGGCVAYAVNYDIHDIDSYFLLAYTAIAAFAAFGIYDAISRFTGTKTLAVGALLLATFVGVEIRSNWDSTDESRNYLVEDYSRAILSSVKPNALILSYQWDYFVAGSYYLQFIKHERPDVVIIDKELLRRSWYFEQIKRNHPDVYERSRQEIALFQGELYKFEHDLPYDPAVIEGRYNAMINSFFNNNASTRPLYVTSEIESYLAPGYQRVPEGLVFRLYADSLYHAFTQQPFSLRPYPHSDKYTTQLYGLIRLMVMQREMYDRKHGESVR